MVANAVIYHPSVATYIKFLANTAGRDKLLRLVQYFARFYAWYLLRTNAVASKITPWAETKKQFGLMRKFFRVGRNIEHLKLAAVAADAKGPVDPFIRYTSVGRQLGYAGYLTFDTAIVLDLAGIKKWEGAKRAQQTSYRFWAAGIVFSILGQLYTLHSLNQREAKVDKKDGEGVVESKRIAIERAASRTQLITDLCDLTIPTTGLGWVNLDDGVVGIAGSVSSLIGIYGLWKKLAAST